MALQQAAIPTYKETSIAFTANSEYFLNRTCEIVAVIELSGAVEMSINDGDYTTCRGGITYKMPDGAEIYSLKFRETAGALASLIISTGNGQIFDNRASFAGNLPVINAPSPNQSLQVDTIAADPGLVALAAAIIAGLQASTALRTRLSGYGTHVELTDSATIFSGAANTDGAILHWASATAAGSGDFANLEIDGKFAFALVNANTAFGFPRDIFIPAGLSLSYVETGTVDAVSVCYTLL